MSLGKSLLDALERMGYGGLVLDTAGQVIHTNDTAILLLKPHGGEGDGEPAPDGTRQALKSLLRSEDSSRFRMDEDSWVVIQRDTERPLILHAVSIAESTASGPHTVVILINLDATPRPKFEALKKIFGLTPSEARLAIEIACGKSPEEIANATDVTVGTLRKQLASVFVKTSTHRQSELVALLTRVSILP